MQYAGLCEHWVLRVSFLWMQLILLALSSRQCSMLSLVGAAASTIFVATKVLLTKLFVTTIFLLWQNFYHDKYLCVCHDKCFVATKLCLSPRKYVCRHKSFVMTTHFRQDKRCVLSQQTHVCHDKQLFWRKMCLSWQNICPDKNDTCGSSRQW